MILASRGLREDDDGRTHRRLSGEFLVAVQGQARRVWLKTTAAAAVVTAAAVVWAALR